MYTYTYVYVYEGDDELDRSIVSILDVAFLKDEAYINPLKTLLLELNLCINL
jgi:hypothetical protein